MRTSDVDILIVPGWTNSGPDHWQSRWERRLSTSRRIEQADWETPRRSDWEVRIVAAVRAATRPVVLVAHSCGVSAIVHAAPQLAAPQLAGSRIAGAFLVAPTEDGRLARDWPVREGGFGNVPRVALPFPARLLASSNDPRCSVEAAQAMGAAWGANTSIIANAGHINTASGHGPWPEGLLTFGQFLKLLG